MPVGDELSVRFGRGEAQKASPTGVRTAAAESINVTEET